MPSPDINTRAAISSRASGISEDEFCRCCGMKNQKQKTCGQQANHPCDNEDRRHTLKRYAEEKESSRSASVSIDRLQQSHSHSASASHSKSSVSRSTSDQENKSPISTPSSHIVSSPPSPVLSSSSPSSSPSRSPKSASSNNKQSVSSRSSSPVSSPVKDAISSESEEEIGEDVGHIKAIPSSLLPDSIFIPRNRLGEGGFASVYKAHISPYGPVAIKLFTASDLELAHKDFLHELTCLKSISHENMIRCYAVCYQRKALIFERLDMNLNSFLIKHRHSYTDIGWMKQLCYIVSEVSQALYYLHREIDMIHFDIKPSNILLNDDGKIIKLADVGLAHIKERDRKNQNQTITIIATGGTEGYLAPEIGQEDNQYKQSEKCDIYSLGCLMAELWTGHSPPACHLRTYEQKLIHYIQELKKRQNNTDESILTIPSYWVELIEDCLQANPDQRPSIQRIIERLDTFWRYK